MDQENYIKIKGPQFGWQVLDVLEYIFHREFQANWEDHWFHHSGHVTLPFEKQSKVHEWMEFDTFIQVLSQWFFDLRTKKVYCNLKYLNKNGTFWTVFSNANNKDALALATTKLCICKLLK